VDTQPFFDPRNSAAPMPRVGPPPLPYHV